MDFLPLIELLDEAGAAMAGAASIGLVFGFFAERTAYCTRTAVLDLARGRGLAAAATWAMGFAAALLAVQLLVHLGLLHLAEARFLSAPQSLSGAVIGGLAFGVGMTLTRGCVSRLVVLAATGNFRAFFCVAVVAVVGLATLTGILVPWRDAVAPLLSTANIGGNEALAHLRLGPLGGVAIGAAVMAGALVLAWRASIGAGRAAGGAIVGLTVAAGWYFTYNLSAQLFDPIPVESLSFIRPVAFTGAWAVDWSLTPGFDQGLVLGVLAGAFLSALLGRRLRLQGFGAPGVPGLPRYAAGAALMGFGGVLAGGCTVGAGLTGGSVLAISALVALASMATGAVLADRFVDRNPQEAPKAARAG